MRAANRTHIATMTDIMPRETMHDKRRPWPFGRALECSSTPSCVSIVTSPSRTIYTGGTNDLERRMWQHRHKTFRGFTADHGVSRLVWFEEFRMIDDAIGREKQIKGWRREKKLALIESQNPKWRDLSHDWFD